MHEFSPKKLHNCNNKPARDLVLDLVLILMKVYCMIHRTSGIQVVINLFFSSKREHLLATLGKVPQITAGSCKLCHQSKQMSGQSGEVH